MTPIPDPAHRVTRLSPAEVADEIWLEVARKETGQVPARAAPQSTAGMPALSPPSQFRTLPSLLALDDGTFIPAAYATILRRAPDEAGAAYMAAELARGTSRIELLGGLQASKEARMAGHRLPGLGPRFLVRRLYRLPVFGHGVRMTAAVLRRTGISRTLLGRNRHGVASDTMMEGHDALREQVHGLTAQLATLQDRLNQQQTAIDAAARRLPALQSIVDTVARRVPALQEASQLSLAARNQQARHQEAAARRLDDLEDSLTAATLSLADQLTGAVTGLEDRVAAQGRQLGELDTDGIARLVEAAGRSLRQDIGGRMERAEAVVASNQAETADQQRRIGLILEAVRRLGHAAPPMPEDHFLDSLYVSFEDRFRGSRSDIKERQRVYLPVLAESDAGQPERPILDVGCGRGEFLHLLQEERLAASGVDSNETMAATCREAGLDVVAGDALAHLATLPDNALGAVTGFHIIEHMPFPTLVRLLDEALRVLAPGGVVIFETPNPANVSTASRWFWLDPTHRHPLPGEMVAMVAEARGYTRISILELHPSGRQFEGADPVLLRQLDALFHGPQDYALLARKP